MQVRKVGMVILSAFVFSLVLHSCFHDAQATERSALENKEGELVWLDIKDLEKVQKNNPKKVIVDVYTDWCKWCKVMDEKTFSDPSMTGVLNDYHLVKLNAEEKSTITFLGKEFNYMSGGRRGYNELATELLKGKLSYPSIVVLDENLESLKITRGFKNPVAFTEFLNNLNL